MAYKYVVVWFKLAKHWLSYTGKSKKLKKQCRRPLECNAKPFRSLEKAKKFQKTFCKPYPKIYELNKNTPITSSKDGSF